MSNPNFPLKSGRYELKPVTIETVDKAVFDYFEKKLTITTDTAQGRKKVPVLFASGERWKLIREKKGIRDENKTLILPLITIQRLDIERQSPLGGLPQEVPYLTVSSIIHPTKGPNLVNMLDNRKRNGFPQVRQDKVVREYLTIPFPDFATVYYQIIIWAQYMSQMNEMLEKIFYAYDYMDSFVMPVEYDEKNQSKKGYYFVGFRDGNVASQSNFEEFTDQERIIRYVYNIKTPVYFILDPKDKPLSYGKDRQFSSNPPKNVLVKQQNTVEVKFKESTVSLEDFEKNQ